MTTGRGLAVAALVWLGPGPGRPLLQAPTADRIEIVVSKEGFHPERVTARAGEALRLTLTAATGEHCFALDAFRVEKRVVAGRPTLVDLTPDRAGTFPFHDCLADPEASKGGRLVVTE